ncbi:MAG TPA: zinc ABC transporter substrate-binding protein [Actinomycetota bacterium]|jgi:zinc transport system substrate-binding protein
MGTILIAIGIAFAAACSSSSGGSAGGSITVVANFYPVYEAARHVGGDGVRVRNLTPSGAEPHDLELSPKQVDEILDAKVVLYMGSGFQPAVEDIAEDRHRDVTVDLLAALASQLRRLKGGESVEGGTDPHVWLDPVLMADIVDEVRNAMTRADPSGASVFDRNAERYRGQIEALDQQFRQGLRHCARRVIVTSHAAFGYLAARYGLVQEPISGLSPEAEPDPKRIAGLADLVRKDGVTTIFTEELVSPRVAETLAREAGVQTAVLNPLEGLTSDELARGETYVSVMKENLATLRVALGCR